MMKFFNLLFLFFYLESATAFSQDTIPLYKVVPNSVPGLNEEITKGNLYLKVSQPSIQVFLPSKEKANGAAVIICPGGSYSSLSYLNEGTNAAAAFNKIGVAAFILKYRLPDSKIMKDKSIGPVQDALQAIKLVRERGAEWNVDTGRVGIIGFSAGGHLASTAGTHFNADLIENKTGSNLRPSFMILVYPVISMTDSLTRSSSRSHLLGIKPGLEKINWFSNEKHVTPNTPPTFLLHAGDDKGVSVLHSIWFYEALLKNKVPAELHVFYSGGHGFWGNKDVKLHWFNQVENWMGRNNWLIKNTE